MLFFFKIIVYVLLLLLVISVGGLIFTRWQSARIVQRQPNVGTMEIHGRLDRRLVLLRRNFA